MAPSGRRPPDSGGGQSRRFLVWFLLPLILTATSQQVAGQESSNLVNSYNDDISQPNVGSRHSPPEIVPQFETEQSRFKKTDIVENKDTHIATLAPAGRGQSVRASLVDRREPHGLSSLPPGARSLQDLEVEDFVLLATLDGVIHANNRKTGVERWALEIPDSPMIQTIHHRRKTTDDLEHIQKVSENTTQDFGGDSLDGDYTFVVEPSRDGDLYIAHKDPKLGLQRLGITVKSLAERTPQYFDDPPLVYIASQESSLYTIDALSGNVLKQFSSTHDSYINNEQSCRRLGGFEILDEEECETRGTLNLGRVQYTVRIQSSKSSKDLCTIKFSEWIPNNRDLDLQAQYTSTMDKTHIYSFHDGRVVGVNYAKGFQGQRQFTQVFSSQVARVFDVVRPSQSKESNVSLTVLEQPQYPPYYVENQLQLPEHEDRVSRVYCNLTDTNTPFLMSEKKYPGITSAAPKAKAPYSTLDASDLDPLDQEIAGWHQLQKSNEWPYTPLTIGGPEQRSDIGRVADHDIAIPSSRSPPFSSSQTSSTLAKVLSCFLVFATVFIVSSYKKPTFAKILRRVLRAMLDAEEVKKLENTKVPDPLTPLSEPTSPTSFNEITVPHQPTSQESQPVATVPSGQVQDAVNEEDIVHVSHLDIATFPGEGNPEEDLSVTSDQKTIKKTKRGCRGGKGKNKKKQEQVVAVETTNFVQEILDTETQTMHVGDVDFEISQVLGQGSQATVYAGKYQGRPVAVKRLIGAGNAVAEKEIKHLMLGDDHENVIRYHAKVTSPMFTYIVLDQCDATLDSFMDSKRNFNTGRIAEQDFDPHDATSQLISGLEHLHALKLVHRDLKPQNILVKYSKTLHPNAKPAKPRYLISDFGLCKKIEDAQGSVFNHTNVNTNNAAGTSGWKAPELLLDPRARIAAPVAASGHSDSGDSIDGTTVDPVSGRRVNKLIDVFAAGCIIHYIHTGSRHPFDDREGFTDLRDQNVRKNGLNIDPFYFDDYTYELEDLIRQMIQFEPQERIDTFAIRKHPYFWSAIKKTNFICEVSDYCEAIKKEADEAMCDPNRGNLNPRSARRAGSNTPGAEHGHNRSPSNTSASKPRGRAAKSEPNHPFLIALQHLASNVIGHDSLGRLQNWLSALPADFTESMSRQRGYDGTRMLHLLRAFRNKKNHFDELPESVKQRINNMKEGYYEFWTRNKFPSLLVNIQTLLIESGLERDVRFLKFFEEVN